jgi:hypothetical protein
VSLRWSYNVGYSQSVCVSYHGGLRYPHLERDASVPDLLTTGIQSLAASK